MVFPSDKLTGYVLEGMEGMEDTLSSHDPGYQNSHCGYYTYASCLLARFSQSVSSAARAHNPFSS